MDALTMSHQRVLLSLLILISAASVFVEATSFPAQTGDDDGESQQGLLELEDYYDMGNETMVYLNSSEYEKGHAVNATRHAGFLHGFVESLSVILVSEVGDKTFFIAAILAMTSNKLVVFLAAISALALMTVLSALLGWVVTKFIPTVYTHYACTVLMFLFGLKMLWEAWRMSPDEASDIEHEVREELERRCSIASNRSLHSQEDGEAGRQNAEEAEENRVSLSPAEASPPSSRNEGGEAEEIEMRPKKAKKTVHIQEKSLFGKRCYKIFKLFVNCFTMTFLAEWGDRSQLATIVLAGINDVAGVCVGGVLGHCVCTGAAVVAGALVAKRISPRTVTLVGAIVFIAFACASLILGPGDGQEEVKIELSQGSA